MSELARETLLGPDERRRLDVLGPEIVGVVPDLRQEIAQPSDDVVRLWFVMSDRLLVSARRSPVHSLEINRRAIEAGKRFLTAVSMLDAVVDQFADAIGRMAAARQRTRRHRGHRHARRALRQSPALSRASSA